VNDLASFEVRSGHPDALCLAVTPDRVLLQEDAVTPDERYGALRPDLDLAPASDSHLLAQDRNVSELSSVFLDSESAPLFLELLRLHFGLEFQSVSSLEILLPRRGEDRTLHFVDDGRHAGRTTPDEHVRAVDPHELVTVFVTSVLGVLSLGARERNERLVDVDESVGDVHRLEVGEVQSVRTVPRLGARLDPDDPPDEQHDLGTVVAERLDDRHRVTVSP